MNKRNTLILFFTAAFTLSFSARAQQAFTLEEIIERAKGNSPFAKSAETRKENRYWAYRYFRTNYNPQLRLDGTLPLYYKSVQQVPQQDGTFRYIPVEQTNNTVTLGLQQPIQWTGGTLSVNSGLRYFKDFNDDGPLAQQWSGTVMNVALTQPLFAYNPLRWDKRTEPLRYEESKREYVEQMESIARDAAERFFNVIQAQSNLQISSFNLANNDTIYKIEQGRYNIGTTSKDKLLQVELGLLRSRQGVSEANLALETSKLQLRFFVGLNNEENFKLALPEVIPTFSVSIEDALDYAKKYRADYIGFQRRRIEADREVAQARGRRYPTTLTAAYGLNNNGLAMTDVYQNPSEQQQFNLTFSVPVMDWGRNKSFLKSAIANQKLNDYLISQDEVNFEQEIMTKVRQFEMMRLQIEITKKADEVATERYMVAQNRYLIGKIDITDLNIALNEKDAAKRDYILALKNFWTQYYDLRALTLFDFSSNTLLYTPEE
jgi:outer membrane protein TolC